MSLVVNSLDDDLSSAVVLDLAFLEEYLQESLRVNIQVLAKGLSQLLWHVTLVHYQLHDARHKVDAILEIFRQWVHRKTVVMYVLGLNVERVDIDDDAGRLVYLQSIQYDVVLLEFDEVLLAIPVAEREWES